MRREPISRGKRLRGRIVVAIRHSVATPIRRRIPLSALRQWHRLRRRVRPQRYTDADPLAVLRIAPERIERSLLETAPNRPQWGRVVDGDWDERSEPFDDRRVPRGLEQRFDEGKAWEDTALYDAYVDQLERFGNAWEYTTIADFDRRCQEVEQLYESIQRDGYREQAELQDKGKTVGVRADEINVDIGRDGTIYWRAYGQHRLAIAKLLAVELVPVVVQRRHREWQRVRDRVRERGQVAALEEYRGHPDLQDIDGVEAV